MPKITRHGGASNMYEIESADLILGSEPFTSAPEVEAKEESSVGDSLSKSSKPTLTIDEILSNGHL